MNIQKTNILLRQNLYSYEEKKSLREDGSLLISPTGVLRRSIKEKTSTTMHLLFHLFPRRILNVFFQVRNSSAVLIMKEARYYNLI